MEVKRILKADMTLQKLSAIAVAVNFWELQAVKSKIHKFGQFQMHDTLFNKCFDKTIRDQWRSLIIQNVEEVVDSLGLPATLVEDIKCYVFAIGGVIFDFILYLSKNGFYVDFGTKIHWASYGKIDLLRMVREWSKGSSGKHSLQNRVLRLWSIYSDDDLVELNMIKFKEKVREVVLESQETISLKDMLLLCLSNEDFLFETRYFWHQLDIAEKKDNVYESAKKCLTSRSEMRYIRQMRTDLLIFFLSEMSDVQRLKFETENGVVLFRTFLETWPHQELCVNILDNSEDFSLSHGDLYKLFDSVLEYLPTNPFFDSSDMKYMNNNVFHAILQKLLGKIPKEMKLKYFTGADFFGYLHLFHDYRTLSIIFNDVHLKQIKHEKLSGINFEYIFELCVSRGKFDFLQKYMECVLCDEEEIELFRQKLNWVSKYACKGDIKVADNLLNFLYPTERERNEVKKKVNVIWVATFIAEKRFREAEEFLKWRFDTEEERKNIKKMLYALDTTEPAEYCSDYVRIRYGCDPMNDYLTWRFESEKERKDMKEAAFSLEIPDSVQHCSRLIEQKKFSEADDYLKWRYGEDDEERKNMKKTMYALETMDPTEFCNDLIKKNNFGTAIDYLKWRFESEEERRHFKRTLYECDEWLRDKCYEILFPKETGDLLFSGREINYWWCSQLLELCLESEEEVREFRRNKLFSIETILKSLKNFPVKILDNFVRYCYRRPEDIEEIRSLIAKNETDSYEEYE